MEYQSYVGGCDMLDVLNISDWEACTLEGDGL